MSTETIAYSVSETYDITYGAHAGGVTEAVGGERIDALAGVSDDESGPMNRHTKAMPVEKGPTGRSVTTGVSDRG